MKHYCIFIFLILFAINSSGQNKTIDIELIRQKENHSEIDKHEHNNTDVLKFKNNSFYIKYNPVSVVFTTLMFVYQKVISPQISADCMYEISCSNFGKLSIYEFGLVKGIFISSDRLTRCNTMVKDEIPAYKYNSITSLVKDEPKDYKVKNEK
ncbi:membrane protein insertion efficiency factor YidD [Bacteroidota bacterium]